MLVDLTPLERELDDPVLKIIAEGDLSFTRLDTGIYQGKHWNPEYGFFAEKLDDNVFRNMPRQLTRYELLLPEDQQTTIRQQWWAAFEQERRRRVKARRRQYSQQYKRNWPYWDDRGPDYGVVDYPEQVLERLPHLRDDDVPRALFVVELLKADQCPSGGWRWHKWGPYLGRQRPQREYLFDEPVIERVFTFHIYEVTK